uniref:Uncharacterized protein n=1 Tax=Parascaris univalens TaxID=6257 RepID=A0A914ZXQ3_PARUN
LIQHAFFAPLQFHTNIVWAHRSYLLPFSLPLFPPPSSILLAGWQVSCSLYHIPLLISMLSANQYSTKRPYSAAKTILPMPKCKVNAPPRLHKRHNNNMILQGKSKLERSSLKRVQSSGH